MAAASISSIGVITRTYPVDLPHGHRDKTNDTSVRDYEKAATRCPLAVIFCSLHLDMQKTCALAQNKCTITI